MTYFLTDKWWKAQSIRIWKWSVKNKQTHKNNLNINECVLKGTLYWHWGTQQERNDIKRYAVYKKDFTYSFVIEDWFLMNMFVEKNAFIRYHYYHFIKWSINLCNNIFEKTKVRCRNATETLQERYRNATGTLQERYRNATGTLQERYKKDKATLQKHYYTGTLQES